MTDEQILTMIEDEKWCYAAAKEERRAGNELIAKKFENVASKLTVRIDHAHFEQEAGL